jgi:hypothetical protein
MARGRPFRVYRPDQHNLDHLGLSQRSGIWLRSMMQSLGPGKGVVGPPSGLV